MPGVRGGRWRLPVVLLIAGALGGCATSRPLMPTPVVYAQGVEEPFADVVPALQSAEADVLYITDRTPEQDQQGRLTYGIGRSPSVAFGSAVVRLGEGTSWKDLTAQARGGEQKLELSLVSVREQARAPETPLEWTLVEGQPVTAPEEEAKNQAVLDALCTELERRLAVTQRKEVFVYVHGVQNTFQDSVFAIAELWHYFGRVGAPVVFSWPAGYGGLLRGYTYDRESGEFAVFHVKQFLYALTQCSQVERISIIAHSRGTDVVATALREMTIAERAAGRDPRRTLRLQNVVLAAPDLDLGVVLQRVASEHVAASAKRFTIYSSGNDKAISISELLFGGLARIGQMSFLTASSERPEMIGRRPKGNVAFVEYTGENGGSAGQSYFRENPAVSSDLVLAIRYDRDPGAKNGRPLRHVEGSFWVIDDEYLSGTVSQP